MRNRVLGECCGSVWVEGVRGMGDGGVEGWRGGLFVYPVGIQCDPWCRWRKRKSRRSSSSKDTALMWIRGCDKVAKYEKV